MLAALSHILRSHVLSKLPLRRSLIFALLTISVHATPAAAQTKVNRGWALNPEAAFKIFTDAGTLRVIGWDKDSVSVTGTLAPNASLFGGGTRDGVKFGIETADGKVPAPSTLVVRVPKRARIWIRGAAANVDVSQFAGALDVSTIAGAISLNVASAELRAETMNGTLNVTASPAYVRLKTATGNITWNGSSEDVGVTTVSGKIVVNAGVVQRARFESIDGDVRFSGNIAPNANVTIDTHSGNVDLAFPPNANLALDVTAAGTDLFGVHRGNDKTVKATQPSKIVSKSVGHPSVAGPMFVVRSYKGFVTAVMQQEFRK